MLKTWAEWKAAVSKYTRPNTTDPLIPAPRAGLGANFVIHGHDNAKYEIKRQ